METNELLKVLYFIITLFSRFKTECCCKLAVWYRQHWKGVYIWVCTLSRKMHVREKYGRGKPRSWFVKFSVCTKNMENHTPNNKTFRNEWISLEVYRSSLEPLTSLTKSSAGIAAWWPHDSQRRVASKSIYAFLTPNHQLSFTSMPLLCCALYLYFCVPRSSQSLSG